GNPFKKCQSDIKKWIPIKFHGDSIAHFGHCSQKFDHMNITLETKAVDFNDRNQFLNKVYIQLLLEWRLIGAFDKFNGERNGTKIIILRRAVSIDKKLAGSTNYVNITSSNGLHNLAGIAFFIPRYVLSYDKKRFVGKVLDAFAMDDLRARWGLGYDIQASFVNNPDSSFFMIMVSGLTHSPMEVEGHIMEMFSFLQVSIEKVLGKHYPVEIKQEFKSLLQMYFNPKSMHTNRIIIHCHGGQPMEGSSTTKNNS
uniref:Uncharacterized protein n=1 Tax=Romanomermis culicivorax TaxID=13658 RepID=A0A915KA11_ROMCU